MRRAAVSVSSDLAEGSARLSRPDFAWFVEIATGSFFEVVSQTALGQLLGLLSKGDYREVYGAADKLGRMPSGLRRSLHDAH